MFSLAAIAKAIVASSVASFLHLDRVAIFQTIWHRPVFIAPALGLFYGMYFEALVVAVVCEFSSILTPPTGGDMPPDESIWAAVSVISFALCGAPVGLISAFMMASMCVLPVANSVERSIRLANDRLAQHAESQAESGDHIPFKRLVFASVLGQLLLYFLVIGGASYIVSVGYIGFSHFSVGLQSAILAGALFAVVVYPAANVLKGTTADAQATWRAAAWGLGALAGFGGWLL